jgi:hypothetical protein
MNINFDEWPTKHGEGIMGFVHPAPTAGYWLFPGSDPQGPGARFHMPNKPSLWSRFWMKHILGFVWINLPPNSPTH